MSARTLKGLAAVALLLVGVGCGPASLIVLEISAPVSVPGEANQLEIVVRAPAENQQLLRITEPLDASMQWPVEVLVEPSGATPSPLELEVTVNLDGTPVARTLAQHTWSEGKLNRVIVPELEPVP